MGSNKQEPPLSIEALRRGDRAEFARLVEHYDAYIYRLALRILGNPQDAEDVLQETFIKAFKHLRTFDGRSSLSTWLYRIATNEALMLLRKQKGVIVSLDEPNPNGEEDQEPLQIVDWCCLPEETLMNTETKKLLEQAIIKLSPALRMVVVLRDLQGLSTRETSQILKISEEAVKTRLSRARLQLRQWLSEYFQQQYGLENLSR